MSRPRSQALTSAHKRSQALTSAHKLLTSDLLLTSAQPHPTTRQPRPCPPTRRAAPRAAPRASPHATATGCERLRAAPPVCSQSLLTESRESAENVCSQAVSVARRSAGSPRATASGLRGRGRLPHASTTRQRVPAAAPPQRRFAALTNCSQTATTKLPDYGAIDDFQPMTWGAENSACVLRGKPNSAKTQEE